MSDNIDIPVEASGEDGINQVVSALERLTAVVQGLGGLSGPDKLKQQVEEMQASMTTGFAEISARMSDYGTKVVAAKKQSDDALEKQAQTSRDRQLGIDQQFYAAQLVADANAENQRAAALQGWIEKRDVQTMQANASAYNDYVSFWEKQLAAQDTAQAAQVALEQKRDVTLNQMRQADLVDYVSFWEKQLAAQDTAQASALASSVAFAQKQKELNAGFQTSSLSSQISTATKAQTLGNSDGSATIKYGSAATTADLAALKAQQDSLATSAAAATAAQKAMNDTIKQTAPAAAIAAAGEVELAIGTRDVEGAFKGAAHEMGIFGLAHGQIAAMLTGAAVTAALHALAEAGAEVEYQLTFLTALSSNLQSVDISRFLTISSTSLASMKDGAEGMRALAEAGFTTQQALGALPDVTRLSALGEMSVAQAAEMAVESMHAFNKETTDLGQITDVLTSVASKANVSVATLAEGLKSAATTGEMLGLTFEETTATVAELAKRGLTIQPLASALTSLYEPSQKVAAAMKANGISAKDASGEFKNYTQFIGELADKLNSIKEPADLEKALGLNSRSAKAIEAMRDLEGYRSELEAASNATGFAFQATAVLADTVEGQFKILSNTLHTQLVAGFLEASPAIEQVELDLRDLLKSDGTVELFGTLATAAANLTEILVKHAEALGIAAGAYAGLKLIASVVTSINSYAVAEAAASAQTAAMTIQVEAQALALGATEVQATASAVRFVELGAGGAVAAEGMGAAAAGAELLSASLGPIAVALGLATVAYELYTAAQSKGNDAQIKTTNSTRSMIQALDDEIAKQRELQAELDKTGTTGAKSAADVLLAQLQTQAQSLKQQISIDTQRPVDTSNAASLEESFEVKADQDRLDRIAKEKTALKGLEDQITELSQKRAEAGLQTQQTQNAQANDALRKRQAALAASAGLGADGGGTDATKALQPEIDAIAKLTVTNANYAEVLKKVADEEAKIKSLKGNAVTVDTKGASDALNADIAKIALKKQLFDIEQKTRLLDLAGQNKSGDLGDLNYLKAQNDEAHKAVQSTIDQAKADISVAAAGKDKLAAVQKYTNLVAAGAQQEVELDTQYANSKRDLFAKMADDELKVQAKTLSDQGKNQAAFLLTYQATYGATVSKVQDDILTATDAGDLANLKKYQDYLAGLKKAGENAAIGKDLEGQFNNVFDGLQNKLKALKDASGPAAGLSAVFSNATAAASLYETEIAKAKVALNALKAMGTQNKTSAGDVSAAEADLKKLQAAAESMGQVWADVGKQIGDSLTDAFGRAGTSLGSLLQATVAYQAQKDKIKSTLADTDASDPVALLQAQQKAAKDLSSAQIDYYGKMATAAQGFFKVGSTGYKVMGDVEKATQVASLVEALRIFVVKSSYLTGLLGIQTATQAEAVAGEGAYTLASVAMSGVRAAAKGVEAIVSAMASLPFPLNLAAGAATLAAIVALGVKISGGGGGSAPDSSATRQAAVGTGSVLGDNSAKSNSIADSLTAIEKDSGLGLVHSASMDTSLKQLVSGISGLASLLVQGTNLASPVAASTNGGVANLLGGSIASVLDPTFSLVNKLTGGLSNKITNAIFGGSTSVTDQGLTLGTNTLGNDINGTSVSQYVDTKTSGGLFSSDKYKTQTTDLGSEIDDQFTKIIKSLSDAVTAGATTLGLGGDAFAAKLKTFVVNIGDISTKGLTGDQIQTALQNALSKLGDDMAKFGVDGLEQFQKVGEGYLTTLSRVANDYVQTSDVLATLGTSFQTTGLAAVTLSENLITAAGDLTTLTTNTGFFVQNFLTEAEQIAPIANSLKTALAGLGESNLTTADQFKDAVLQAAAGAAAGTAGAADLYAALIALAPQFKQVTDYANELAGITIKTPQDIASEKSDLQDQYDQLTMTSTELLAKQRDALDASNQALFDQVQALKTAADERTNSLDLESQIYAATGNAAGAAAVLEQQHLLALQGLTPAMAALNEQLWVAQAAATVTAKQDALTSAYQSQASAMQSAIDSLKSFQKTLSDLKTSLQQGALTTLSPADQLAQAKATYESTLAAAQGGDTTAQGQLSQDATAYLTADKAFNASNSQYASDANQVQKDLSKLYDSTTVQVDVQQQQLDQMTKEVTALVSIQDALTAGFVKVQQAIVDLATSMQALTVAQAGTAAPGQNASAVAADRSVVDNLYQQYLGRAPQKSGEDFWTNALMSGTSLTDVIQGFLTSPEYLATHAHAKGGTASGMSMVGEQGREMVDFDHPAQVYTADQTAGMFAPRTNSDPQVVLLLQQLLESSKADKLQMAALAAQLADQQAQLLEAQRATKRALKEQK